MKRDKDWLKKQIFKTRKCFLNWTEQEKKIAIAGRNKKKENNFK